MTTAPLIPLLIIASVFGVSLIIPTSALTNNTLLVKKLSKAPHAAQLHQSLAAIYSANHKTKDAKDESLLAVKLSNNNGVSEENIAIANRETVQKKIAYWEKITAEHPTYTGALVQLLYISYEQKDRGKHLEYFNRLAILDPVNAERLPAEIQDFRL